MELEDIKGRLKEIKKSAEIEDDEIAHQKEDKLLKDFIKHISREAPEPFKTKAKEVLKSKKIDFGRACS